MGQHLAVLLVESAQQQGGTWCHDADKTAHVLKQDVTVDIGHDQVEGGLLGVE